VSAAAPKRNSILGAGAPSGQRACFPRSVRLLRHADFERVYKLGKRHFSASMTFFYLEREGVPARGDAEKVRGLRAAKIDRDTGSFRIGFTVGRALGGAVQRNRMKRRLREAVRLSRPPRIIAADVVVNPKKSLLTADFRVVVNEVSKAFEVIKHKLGETRDIPPGAATKTSSGTRKPEAGTQ
jgi:ribonuclease P protein component